MPSASLTTARDLRRVAWMAAKAAASGMVYLFPWAVGVCVFDLVLVNRVARRAGLELAGGGWLRAVWESGFDDDGFRESLLPRLANSFEGTISDVEGALRVGLVAAGIATTWFQALSASAALEPDRRRASVVAHALRRWPSVVVAWSIPVGALWAFFAYVVLPAGRSGNPWLAWPIAAVGVGLVVLILPRLLFVPAMAVAVRAAPGTGWAWALIGSIMAVNGRMYDVWGVIGWGVFWPTAFVLALSVMAATLTASVVVLSISILLTGIPFALGGLAAAGAVVMQEIGIEATDRR